ncbi:MAG: DUF368 domain-containing protein [Oscillospiraceae bacterium]
MKTLSVITCGLAVGAAMTLPGVSGGSAAMVLGIYDRLVMSVSRVFNEPEKSLPLLLKFGLGALAGMLLFARLISFLLTTPLEIPLRFLFLGAVAGGIPMIFRRAELKRITAVNAALILAGAAAVVALSLLPEGLFTPDGGGLAGLLLELLGGVMVAVALVLPGISASHLLYMLGIYDPVMEKLASLELLSLLPMGIGLLVGTFLTAKVLERLIERHQAGTFMVILGFMLASLRELVPAGADVVQIISGLLCAGVGFVAVYWLQADKNKRRTDVRNDR